MNKKKKICWVTPDCFIDVDIPIIPHLLNEYDIQWIILFPAKDCRFEESDFNQLRKENDNLSVEFLHNTRRERSPMNVFHYWKIRSIIKRVNPDLIYFNRTPTSPYLLPLYLWLPKNKTIVTAHDGSIKSIMRFAALTNWQFKKCYCSKKYVQMFSPSQAKLFRENYPGPEVNIIPLAPKDYGKPTVNKRTDCISFVSFGTMHPEKNIGLLVDAAEQLCEEGLRGFKVSINGKWSETYDINERIKHPEIFELNLGLVPNEDIANLFGYNHYAVLPYKAMSQSGAVKVAYNYYNPVIVSDLEGFTDEVIDGTDGFVFKSEDIESLKRVMRKCVEGGTELYNKMEAKFKQHVDAAYSLPAIVDKYITMFDEVIKNHG